jgi:hypothetical protein
MMTPADDLVTEFLDMVVIKDLIRACRGKDDVGVRIAVARHEALREGAPVAEVEVSGGGIIEGWRQ